MAEDQKPKDPNWVCTFTLKKNPGKTEKKHPDFILVKEFLVKKIKSPFINVNYEIKKGFIIKYLLILICKTLLNSLICSNDNSSIFILSTRSLFLK